MYIYNYVFVQNLSNFLFLQNYNRPWMLLEQSEEIIFASGLVGLFVLQTVIYNRFYLKSRNNGINLRKAICGIVYRKVGKQKQ